MFRWVARSLAVAMLLVASLVGNAGLSHASTWDTIKQYASSVLNGPHSCTTSSGARGYPMPDVSSGANWRDAPVTCQRLNAGSVEVTPARAVSSLGPKALSLLKGLPGVSKAGQTFKTVQGRCTSNAQRCADIAQLGLLSLMTGGALAYGASQYLDLFARENDDYVPINGEEWPNGGRFEESPRLANQKLVDVRPIGLTRDGNYTRFHFDVELLGWRVSVPSYLQTNTVFTFRFQCVSADGNFSEMYTTGVSGGLLFDGLKEPTPDKVGDVKQTTISTFSAFCRGGGTVNFSELIAPPAYGAQGSGPSMHHFFGAEGIYGGDSADPLSEGTGVARLECLDSLGSGYYVLSTAAAGTWNIPVPKCNGQDRPIGIEVGPLAPGGGLTTPDVKYDFREAGPNLDEYPQCGETSCLYQVRINGIPCVTGQAGCIQWTRNANAECYYGPYKVDRRLCGGLERYYEIQSASIPVGSVNPATGATPNTDGNPDTSSGPQPEPELNPVRPPSGPGTGTTAPPGAAVCTSSTYPSLGNLQPHTVRLADVAGPMFGITDIGGYRASDPYPDHPGGYALDFMTYSDTAKGQALADWLVANASTYRVRYILWNQQSWYDTRPPDTAWRPMADRGNPTQNHMDHVHVSLYDLRGGTSADCGSVPDGGASGECFPNGWTWNPINWVLEPTKCALRWAFVPDPIKTDIAIANVRTAWMTHPPGSIVTALQPTISDLGSSFTNGSCSGLPSMTPPGTAAEVRLPCEPPSGNPWSAVYLVAQSGIVVATLFALWHMVAAAVSARATGAD